MNTPPTPPPDWDAIFYVARRRIVGRLLLVGAVGAFCALLLLGGGLSAQGAVSLGIGGGGNGGKPDANPTAAETKAKAKANHRKRKTAEHQAAAHKSHEKAHKKKEKKEKKDEHHPMWNPCSGGSGSSAEQQYCEGAEDSDATGGTGTSDTTEPGDETGSDQQVAPTTTTPTVPAG